MNKCFSLLLPTRDHPKLVKRLVYSIVQTTSNLDNLEIILYLEEDDAESYEICRSFFSTSSVIGKKENMGNIFRKCYENSHGRFLMLLNDDMLFHTKSWDIKVLEAFSHFSDEISLVYGNDLYYGKRMSTFPIFSRTACELMDNICPVEYKRHCIDPHILDIFKRLEKLGHKRAVYLGNVIFEHMHNELGILINDPESTPQGDGDDQELFFKFADYRQQVAEKMAEYIKNYSINRKNALC